MDTAKFPSLCPCIGPTGRLATRLTAPRRTSWQKKSRGEEMKKSTRRRGMRRKRERSVTRRRNLKQPLTGPARRWTRDHTPTLTTAEAESRPVSPSPAPSPPSTTTTLALTGAQSPLPHRPFTPSPALVPHLMPHLSTARAKRTETGSPTQASAPRPRPQETATLSSTRMRRTWGSSRADTELLRCTNAQGLRRSTADASLR